MKLFDLVALTEDLPEESLRRGMVGTIVASFDTPESGYEAEFADDRGETLFEVALTASRLDVCQTVTRNAPPRQ